MQWVNAGYFGSNGWGSDADYSTPDLLDRLADPSPANAALRRQIFEQFRSPDDAAERTRTRRRRCTATASPSRRGRRTSG